MKTLACELLAIVVLAAACSESSRPRGGERSSPFQVGRTPARYELTTAGTGTAAQSWGSDFDGTEEPLTVLAPPGEGASSKRAFVVSVTGFEGMEGKLSQAAQSDLRSARRFTLDGREAIFGPTPTMNELIAVRDDDLAVRVRGKTSENQLIDLLRRVRPSRDHARAPAIPHPPAGLRVLGSVDAGLVVGLNPQFRARTDDVPGTSTAHGMGWLDGENHLAVMTLPGEAVDLDALGALEKRTRQETSTVRHRQVGGRRGAVIALRYESSNYRQLAVLSEASWGDAVLVAASGTSVPTETELVSLATSVRRISDEAWNRFVVDATGGPGLNPDARAVELTRGRAGGLGWLFQAVPVDDSRIDKGRSTAALPVEPTPALVVDYCLKLSNRRRTCASGGEQSLRDTVFCCGGGVESSRRGFAFPEFLIVVTSKQGSTSARVQNGPETATGKFDPVPRTDLAAAVVFLHNPGMPVCGEIPEAPKPSFTLMRIDLLDAGGRVLGCAGLGANRAGSQ